MKYFLIGNKRDIGKYLGKNALQDAYEVKGGILAVIVEKLPHKSNTEEVIGISIVSEEKFVRFLETNNAKAINEKSDKSVSAE